MSATLSIRTRLSCIRLRRLNRAPEEVVSHLPTRVWSGQLWEKESDWLKRNLLNEYVCLSRIYPLVLSTIQCFLTPHSTASFKDTSGAQFKWKVDKATQNMSVSRRTAWQACCRSQVTFYPQLYEAGSSQQPLATYRRARDVSVPPPGSNLSSSSMLSLPWLSTSTLHTVRNGVSSASGRVEKEEYKRRVPATLALSPAAISMQDLVVLSYLLFQRARRPPTSSSTEDDVSVSADGKTLVDAVGELFLRSCYQHRMLTAKQASPCAFRTTRTRR